MSDGLVARRLCVVTDRRRLARAASRPFETAVDLLLAQATAAVAAGVGAIQLREPDLDAEALLTLALAMRAVIGDATQFLVNDRADVAAAAGAGVHLKERSMPAARVRLAFPALSPIWRAVHDVSGARHAGPVDALLAGTVGPTASKEGAVTTLGVEGLAAIVGATSLPVYAIGGLTGATWPDLAASGAFGAAAIGVFLPRPGEDIAQAMYRAVRGFANGVDG